MEFLNSYSSIEQSSSSSTGAESIAAGVDRAHHEPACRHLPLSESLHENHGSTNASCAVGRQDGSAATALLHQPHGPCGLPRGFHGELRVSQLAAGGDLHR